MPKTVISIFDPQFSHTIATRFWSKVDAGPDSDCWQWMGTKIPSGYGTIGKGARVAGKTYAHRVSWLIVRGNIPDGLSVLHRCDNPSCVNPKHLFLGTASDNMVDCIKKGRMRYTPHTKCGENNPSAKLTDREVLEIRQSAGVKQRDLAAKYGVTQSHISLVRRNLTRSCVTKAD